MVCNGKLTGIISHSMDRGCYDGRPQAYTNIKHYIDWIKTAAAPTTPKPPTTTTETTASPITKPTTAPTTTEDPTTTTAKTIIETTGPPWALIIFFIVTGFIFCIAAYIKYGTQWSCFTNREDYERIK